MSPLARLEQALAPFPHTRIVHPAAHSATEMAAVRGTPLHLGAKALLMKLGRDRFVILGVPAHRRLDGRALRRGLGVQRYRFATRDELHTLTTLRPGCVPPVGRPVFDLDLFVDAELAQGLELIFSLATPITSVRMATRDYLVMAQPTGVVPLTG